MSQFSLKTRHEIFERDPWWDAFGAPLPNGEILRRSLDDHYSAIEAIRLAPTVPEDVRQPFETARNLYLYAYLVNQFLMVAELQVRVSVEFALRERAKQEKMSVRKNAGLAYLLGMAIRRRWILDDGFARFQMNEEIRRHNREVWPEVFEDLPEPLRNDSQRYCKILAESFPKIRNVLAHGSNMLYSTVLGSFEIAADLINQLFAQSSSK